MVYFMSVIPLKKWENGPGWDYVGVGTETAGDQEEYLWGMGVSAPVMAENHLCIMILLKQNLEAQFCQKKYHCSRKHKTFTFLTYNCSTFPFTYLKTPQCILL